MWRAPASPYIRSFVIDDNWTKEIARPMCFLFKTKSKSVVSFVHYYKYRVPYHYSTHKKGVEIELHYG